MYDAELAVFEPIRRAAVARLGLRAGAKVLDVGCGTGLSLPLLHAAVGPGGRIVGIEQCPEMLAQARERVAEHGWGNVTLIEAAAEDAALDPGADAAFFHFTHDILRSPDAIGNVARSLAPGACVVAAGLQWSSLWLWPINLFVLGAALHSVSSLGGLARPWTLLAEQLEGFQVEAHAAGAVYLGSGLARAPAR